MAGGAANAAGGIVNTAGGAMNQVGGKQIRGDEGESVRKGKCERGQEGGGERLPERKERPTLGRMYGLYRHSLCLWLASPRITRRTAQPGTPPTSTWS